MSTAVRALLLAALLTLAPVTIGVVVADDQSPQRPAVSYEAIDLADFDTTTAVVRRAPFCELLPQAAVDDAVGPDAEVTPYVNGEESSAIPGGDIAHEYGCVFDVPTGTDRTGATQAAAWVFAPPVTATRAQELVKAAQTKSCTTPADAPAYGSPSVALVCTAKGRQTVSWRGLFGDAWLVCTLTATAGGDVAALTGQTSRWCVAVAQAASVPLAEPTD